MLRNSPDVRSAVDALADARANLRIAKRDLHEAEIILAEMVLRAIIDGKLPPHVLTVNMRRLLRYLEDPSK